MFRCCHFVLVLFFALQTLHAQGQTLTARTLNIDDGLSQSAVGDIIKGPKGYYWFATQDGLNRYDGYGFQVFTTQSSPELKSNYITRIVVLDTEHILIGTASGLYVLNVSTEKVTAVLPAQLGTLSVQDLQVTEKNVLVSANEQLFLLNKELNLHSAHVDLNADPIQSGRSLFTYLGEQYYVSATNQLSPLFKNQSLPLAIKFFNSSEKSKIYTALDSQLGLWIATVDGVWKLTDAYTIKAVDDIDARIIELDNKHRLWVAGVDGLFIGQTNKGSKIKLKKINTESKETGVLQTRILIHIYADIDGLIWLGTHNKGVALHASDNEWFENHSTASNELELPSSDTLSILAEPYNLWIATADGLLHYKGNKKQLFTKNNQPDFYTNRVTKVTQDEYGRIWLGFNQGGLVYKDAGHSNFKQLAISDSNVQVTDFLLKDRNLFVTTREQGLFVINVISKQVKQFEKSDSNGLTINNLQSIALDQNGSIWIGSFGKGIFKFDLQAEEFIAISKIYSKTPNLLNNSIISDLLFVDEYLWIPTANGLFLLDKRDETFSHMTTEDGIPHNIIYTVLPDQEGNLWLPTNKGIAIYNPKTKYVSSFSKKDGFINSEYNANAFYVASDGKVWAGGISGLTVIQPSLRPKVRKQISPRLTDIRLFNQTLDTQTKNQVWNKKAGEQKLTLDSEVSMFSLYFSAFRPDISNAIRYKYKLSGFDKQWIVSEAGINFATYTNIEHGQYKFLLSASTDGQNWSESYVIDVEVMAPIWLTLQAKILYVLTTILMISIFSYLWFSKRKIEKESFDKTKQNEQKLQLSMHTSGSILWELDLVNEQISIIDYQSVTPENRVIPITKSALNDILHPDDVAILLSTLATTHTNKGFMKEQYFRFKNAEGQFVWMRGKSIVSQRDERGNAQHIMGVSFNVDELKTTQVALRELNQDLELRVEDRTKQLNSSNRDLKITLDNLQYAQEELLESQKMASLGSMVAGISHEINTPLGICVTAVSHLSNALDSLQVKFDDKSLTASDFKAFMENCSTSFDLLDKNVYRAAELIKSFKQVSVDQSSEELRTFHLSKLLDDTMNTLVPEFKNRSIESVLECNSDVELTSYPGAISQIVINLIMNSLTHGFSDSESGKIQITVSNILDEYDEVLIIYSDNGKGIEEKNLSKIFDPFYTSNRSGGNTGLGMHITYNLIVQKLKGAIAINSLPTIGAEFYIRLPKTMIEEAQQASS